MKNKGKDRADPPRIPPQNPFSTPTKPAPSRISLNSPTEPSSSTHPTAPLSPILKTSAISRARKRLRGEPVSPSPNKEKKQRTNSHPKILLPALDDDTVTGSTVIGESPLKQPAGNRSFTVLFEESLPPLVLEPKKESDADVQAKRFTSLESPSLEQSLPSFDEELGWLKNSHALRDKPKRQSHTHRARVPQEAPKEPSTSRAGNGHESFKSVKRSLLEMESEISDTSNSRQDNMLTLIPPSPPPETDSSFTRKSKAQMKSRAMAVNRKKVKTSNPSPSDDESSEESGGDPQLKFKVVNSIASRSLQGRRGDNDGDESLELDPDPILGYTSRSKVHSPQGIHSPREAFGGKIEVDLPDKLRDVLALDVVDIEARDKHAERVVEELLYNRRTVHYDPDKGGEIWGVGEDSKPTRIGWDGEALPDTEGEEDWEGEPVPWEVAEL